MRGFGAEGGGAGPARGVPNRRHNVDVTIVITVFFLRAEGHEQRPAGLSTGPSRRCG
jgi:hypothetical protein